MCEKWKTFLELQFPVNTEISCESIFLLNIQNCFTTGISLSRCPLPFLLDKKISWEFRRRILKFARRKNSKVQCAQLLVTLLNNTTLVIHKIRLSLFLISTRERWLTDSVAIGRSASSTAVAPTLRHYKRVVQTCRTNVRTYVCIVYMHKRDIRIVRTYERVVSTYKCVVRSYARIVCTDVRTYARLYVRRYHSHVYFYAIDKVIVNIRFLWFP